MRDIASTSYTAAPPLDPGSAALRALAGVTFKLSSFTTCLTVSAYQSILLRMAYYVYIMASRKHGTLYVGVTGNIAARAYQHREGLVEGFTRRFDVKTLVHVETFDDPRFAIEREKRLKRWRRAWKVQLIEADNPEWRDLYDDLNA